MHRPQPPIFTPQICFPSISVRDKCPSSCSGRMPLSPLICSPSPKSGFQPITLTPSQPFHPAQPALCVNLCHLMTFALDPNQCPACPVHSLYSSPSGHSFIQQILNICRVSGIILGVVMSINTTQLFLHKSQVVFTHGPPVIASCSEENPDSFLGLAGPIAGLPAHASSLSLPGIWVPGPSLICPQTCQAHSHLTCYSLDLGDVCKLASSVNEILAFRKAFPDHPFTLCSLHLPAFFFLHSTLCDIFPCLMCLLYACPSNL